MKQNSTQHYIIFDIDSDSIAALVFEKVLDKKTRKYIYAQVFTTRKNILNKDTSDFKKFYSKTLKVFEQVAIDAHKYSGNDIADIYINISAPWISSQKRILHYEKGTEFTFTKEIEEKIITKELGESLKHTQDFKDFNDLNLVERKTLDIYANGYPSRNPYGSLVTDIDIHSLVSVMSSDTKQDFNHVIERNFHRDAVFFSNVYMAYQSLVKLFPHENDILVMDISGENTEITIIVDDHLQKTGVVSMGLRGIVRHLATVLAIPETKAESLIIMYQDNNLTDTYKKSIETAMKQSFMLWFKELYSFLDDVSAENAIPSTVMLLAPEEYQNWFNEWLLKTDEFAAHIHARKQISLLDIKFEFRRQKQTELSTITDDNLALILWFVEHSFLK